MTAMHRSFLAGVTCVLAALSVQAEDNAQPNFAEDTLTGDWGGGRTAAAKRGFSFESGVKVDTLRNRGALGNGHKTVSHIDLKLKMDLAKAAGWSGGSAMINVISDSGWGPNARHVGGYLLGERTLMRLGGNNDRFVTGFARYTFADGDSSAIGNSLNLGIHAKSPFASRPDDILGLVWTRAGLADKWRRAQTVATASNETALEVTYRYAVTPWFAVQPSYQYIRNPSLTPGTPNAMLIGVRLELTL